VRRFSPGGAELVPHLSMDTAVPPLSSAHFPRRKGRNWVFALSQGERVDRDPDALHRDAGRVRGYLHGGEGSDGPT
jgi:hypothetical protein